MKKFKLLLLLTLVGYNAFSQSDVRISSYQKISNSNGNLGNILGDNYIFGTSADNIGDLDNNGYNDIITGAVRNSDGGTDRGAAYVLFMDTLDKVKKVQKLSHTSGNIGFSLSDYALFGTAASIGDLDQDGVTDVAVGSMGDNSYRGAVYILFLKTDGTVKSSKKIAPGYSGFTPSLSYNDLFGIAVAQIGDVNGDGIQDIAVGCPHDADGGTNRGAIFILFMKRDGTVNSFSKISSTAGNFKGSLINNSQLGVGITSIGDFDADGIPDIAVGANQDDNSDNIKSGSVYLMFLKSDGSVKSHKKISNDNSGFPNVINSGAGFGSSLSFVKDIDLNGINLLAVGAHVDEGFGVARGSVYFLYLNKDGNVICHQKLSDETPDFKGVLEDQDRFGHSVTNLSINKNENTITFAIGSQNDDDNATNSGALYIFKNKILDAKLTKFSSLNINYNDSSQSEGVIVANNNISTQIKNAEVIFRLYKDNKLILEEKKPVISGKTGYIAYYPQSFYTQQVGTYVVYAENAYNGDVISCNDIITDTLIISNNVGIAEVNILKRLEVYPNPTTGKFQYKLQLEDIKFTSVELRDLNGRIIENIAFDTENKTIDLKHLQNGVYMVCITTNKRKYYGKVILQK